MIPDHVWISAERFHELRGEQCPQGARGLTVHIEDGGWHYQDSQPTFEKQGETDPAKEP